MIFQKKRLGSNILEIHGIDSKKSVQTEMLDNNELEYVVKMHFHEFDNEKIMMCRMDDKLPLAGLFTRKNITVSDIRTIFYDLAACIGELEEYMLSADDLVLETRYILFDMMKGHYTFICAPGYDSTFKSQFRELMENIMMVMDHSDTAAIIGIYDFFAGYVIREDFSPSIFVRAISDFGRRSGGVPLLMAPDSTMGSPYYSGEESEIGASRNRTEYSPVAASVTYSENDIEKNIKKDIKKDKKIETGEDREKKVYINKDQNCSGENRIDRHINRLVENVVLYCAGGGILAVGIILFIVFGAASLKITAIIGVVYFVSIMMRYFNQKEEADAEEAMIEYAENSRNDVEDLYISNINTRRAYDTDTSVIKTDREDYLSDRTVMNDNAASEGRCVSKLIPVDVDIIKSTAQLELTGDRITVGRISSMVDFCLPVKGISRIHAEIIRSGESYLLNDLESTNGTYVNSIRISEPTKLNYGDIVSFSNVDFYCV
ncbi:MAG: FHA domain-containing protein [Eubacterium sp.]|nr:FHA domain-containing protein [Eubacterium sp.]